MTASERRIATRAAVLETMRKTGLDYDSSFEFVMATRGDLAGEMAKPPELANGHIDDPVGAAQRQQELMRLVNQYIEDFGLDRKVDYDRAFRAVAKAHPELFVSAQPRRSPQHSWQLTRGGDVTPPSKFPPYTKRGQPDVSSLSSNPRTKALAR